MEGEKTRVKRNPSRAVYEFEKIAEILDSEFICNIGFSHNGYPVVIPVMYGRKDKELYIHGSVLSRMFTDLQAGIDICVTVNIVDGLVLAKSAFHHSLNYRSVMIFGKAKPIAGDQKMMALKCISDQMLSGRWDEVRLPDERELKITSVLSISIDEFSAKLREGDPKDDRADLDLEYWSGVVPVQKKFLPAIADSYSKEKELPVSVVNLSRHERSDQTVTLNNITK